MKIIEGFVAAKAALSRQAPSGLYPVSPRMQQRLKELFGVDTPEQAVQQIVTEVRNRGDKALLDYTLKIDGIKLSSLEVTKEQISNAYQEVDASLISALKLAAERIRSFHTAQRDSMLGGAGKSGIGWLIHPLARVGLYVPGGTASYPSTVLMTAVPARVAGVKEVILVTPPASSGAVPSLTLVAADIAKVDRIFAIGGAQAVAALAYGTESVPRVDKICGPGNIFVVLAKKLVYGTVGIDGLQGPSEILIIADDTANTKYCVADLLAQAEHDPLASATMVTTSWRVATEVNQEIKQQLGSLTRQKIASESLETRGTIAIVASIDEAIELANLYAPEHLSLMVAKAASYVSRLTNAGCIFVGEKSSVVLGDYVAGPSHVLPTGGTARFTSPLNVTDFVKITNVVTIDKASLKELSQATQALAKAEGLAAHAAAAAIRLEKLG